VKVKSKQLKKILPLNQIKLIKKIRRTWQAKKLKLEISFSSLSGPFILYSFLLILIKEE